MTRIFSAILILLLGLLLPMQVSTQQKDPAMRSLEKVWSDAGKKSGMQLDDEAKLEIIKKYESLPTDAKKSIESGPWEPIENRIEGYLVAKKIAGAPSILSKKEVSDFSWYYIYYRTALIPIPWLGGKRLQLLFG